MSLTGEDIATIQRTHLFSALSEESLRIVTNNASPTDHPKKKLLFEEGDEADHFYIVLKGRVKLYRCSFDGHEAIIQIFGPGETFAECAMFLGAKFPVAAEIVADARLVRVEGEVLRRVIRQQPDIFFAMMASASQHLKQLVNQIEQMKVYSVPERVADFLLGLTSVESGTAEIDLPYEKMLIAHTLGMKAESFSRALAKLRSIGVAVDHEHIRIEDVVKLREYVTKVPSKESLTLCNRQI